MLIVASILIARPIEEVFAFIAEPRNDPAWCRKVHSVEQVAGVGPGPGARYDVLHRPIPLRAVRRMAYFCVAWEPPSRIEWREEDATDLLSVVYELDARGRSTYLTQRDDAQIGAPRLLRPLMRVGIARDIDRQLQALKRLLESGGTKEAPTTHR